MHRSLLAALAATAVLLPATARADENVLAYSYGSETLPKGGTEFYLWATDRRDKGAGDYSAQDYKLELEHGFTDRFQGSLYMNFLSVHANGLEPAIEDINRDFAWNGMQLALKYSLLSPYKDGIGLALYLEPGFARYSGTDGEREDKRSLEGKILLQKNFADDRLTWIANITGEQEWEREPGDEDWEKAFEFEVSSGLAYRVAPGWNLGGEGRYSSTYVDGAREKSALFAGPTVHYSGRKWWGTLSFQKQLAGDPNVRSDSLNLGGYTDREVRLKLGYNF